MMLCCATMCSSSSGIAISIFFTSHQFNSPYTCNAWYLPSCYRSSIHRRRPDTILRATRYAVWKTNSRDFAPAMQPTMTLCLYTDWWVTRDTSPCLERTKPKLAGHRLVQKARRELSRSFLFSWVSHNFNLVFDLVTRNYTRPL